MTEEADVSRQWQESVKVVQDMDENTETVLRCAVRLADGFNVGVYQFPVLF